MGGAIPVADLLLCRRRILEHGRGGTVWLHDQSSDCSLLHARAEYDASARTRGSLWRLRNAGDGPDARLLARYDAGSRVERETPRHRVLGHEHRTSDDVRRKPVAGWPASNVGFRGQWILVCPERRVSPHPADADAPLDARS